MEVYKINALLESLKKIHNMASSNRIVVEINEKAITNKNKMSRLRNGWKKLNIGLAFDDFGAGKLDWWSLPRLLQIILNLTHP